jgi:hypothetical protein
MKFLSVKILMGKALLGAAFFLMFSCGTVDYAKKYPNMVANVGPYSVGTIEAQIDKFFSSKVKTTEVIVFFYPRLNSVALEFKYELITYRQFWDEENRKAFAAALELYKKDYEERKLIKRPRRTRAVYGKMLGRNEWETFKFAKNRVAFPVINLGYRFKKDVPYFAVLMQSALETDDSLENTNRLESPQITMYFTRAQADELVEFFDQSFLLATLENLGKYTPEEPRGFLGLDWSIFRNRNNAKSNQEVIGDSYTEDKGE